MRKEKHLKHPSIQEIDSRTYVSFLADLKTRIHAAQIKAAVSVNREMIGLYWEIGRMISERQDTEGWGSKVIDRLAVDLKNELPAVKGFSARNMRRMKLFFDEYPLLQEVATQTQLTENTEKQIRPQLAAKLALGSLELPWMHNSLLIEKVKDPYVFDFLTLAEPFRERELETALVRHLQDFLVELGVGFAFVGRQYRVEVGDDDFHIDLLFYHLKLRCYVVIDLKRGAFRPAYAGQLNFYLNVVDDKLRHADDNATIGLILCQEKKRVVAEYALQSLDKAIGVSEYELTRTLPEKIKGSLPEIEELEAALAGESDT